MFYLNKSKHIVTILNENLHLVGFELFSFPSEFCCFSISRSTSPKNKGASSSSTTGTGAESGIKAGTGTDSDEIGSGGKIVLIEELPSFALRKKDDFHEILFQVKHFFKLKKLIFI